ncbi:MAG: SIMPL domain-containing protein [Methanoregula sp.]|jgi:hypothetical protein
MMRKLNFFIIALVLVTMAVIGCAGAQTTDTANVNVIHVSGSGSVTGTPDRVQLTFSVQTENANVKTAQSDNAVRMNAVIDALVGAGIPKEQMKTTGYSIYPVYQDSTGLLNPKITTYQVTNTLQVTLKDVNQTGNVIDTAVTNGINTVSSIQFMLSDEQAQMLRADALKKAVTLARADADIVAAALGVNITGTQSADISQGYTPVVYDSYMAGAATSKSAVPTPIQPGDVTVTAQVSITYSIR